MSKLMFKPEDFILANESLNPGMSVAYILAEKANARLVEMLTEAPMMNVCKRLFTDKNGFYYVASSETLPFYTTHRARLVEIEEIGSQEPKKK